MLVTMKLPTFYQHFKMANVGNFEKKLPTLYFFLIVSNYYN
jgi:hypothetical protein